MDFVIAVWQDNCEVSVEIDVENATAISLVWLWMVYVEIALKMFQYATNATKYSATKNQNLLIKKSKEVIGKLEITVKKIIEKYKKGDREEVATEALKRFLERVSLLFPELARVAKL